MTYGTYRTLYISGFWMLIFAFFLIVLYSIMGTTMTEPPIILPIGISIFLCGGVYFVLFLRKPAQIINAKPTMTPKSVGFRK